MARLLTFSIRALALLLAISILWISAARPYNQILVWLSQPFVPDGMTIKVLGVNLLFQDTAEVSSISIDALTLHYGLILLIVLVLAAVGIRTLSRIGWLIGLSFGAFVSHAAGVVMLAHGVVWAANTDSPAESGRLMFSLFAVMWGLLPALIGGVWCFAYWLPRAGRSANRSGSRAFDATLSSH